MLRSTDKEESDNDYLKLAQLHNASQNVQGARSRDMVMQNILEQHWNINYKITANDYLKTFKPDLIGCSALHLAFNADDFDFFTTVLQCGADYLTKYNDMTIIHRAVEENFDKNETFEIKRRFEVCGKRTDMTTKDLHNFIVIKNNVNEGDNWRLWGKLNNRFVDSILSAQLKDNNASNPRNKNGFSHFHAACLTNNYKAAKLFLEYGADVNEAVNMNSPYYPGYTPIEFAVRCSSLEMVRLLLKYKAKVDIQRNKLLRILIDQNIRIIQWMNLENSLPYENASSDFVNNEKIAELLLDSTETNENSDLLHFYVACTLRDTARVQRFLKTGIHVNDYVDFDSPMWPGYTALHFAAFFNIKIAKLLVENGADIDIKNKNGFTPFDIIVTRASITDIHFILSTKSEWKNITLSDGKTRLADLIASMKNLDIFDNFLSTTNVNAHLPFNSPLWPGYTILHLAVLFSETMKREKFFDNIDKNTTINGKREFTKYCQEQEEVHLEKINVCLRWNADVTAQDVRGWTPLHLAFRQRKMNATKLLLRHLKDSKNIVDQDNLSFLHIACAMTCKDSVEKLASKEDLDKHVSSTFKWDIDFYKCISKNVFKIVGSSPLHVAVSTESREIISVIIGIAVDMNSKDAEGMTIMDRISAMENVWNIGNRIFNWFTPQESFHATLSDLTHKYFVFDAYRDAIVNLEIIRRKLDSVSQSDRRYLIRSSSQILLESYDGGDILAKQDDGSIFLFKLMENRGYESTDFVVEKLTQDETLQIRLREIFGITMLHVACHYCNVELVKESLTNKIDVNAHVNEDCPFSPGSTALHILMVTINLYGRNDRYAKDGETILRLLLEANADVTLTDAKNNTPLHHRGYSTATFKGSNGFPFNKILPDHIQNFNVNPINDIGLSIFHMACIENDHRVISEFLKCGVDVNRPVDLFASSQFKGSTPLHLVLKNPVDPESQLKIIQMLFDYGADVNLEDVVGDTPLHLTARTKTRPINLLEIFIRKGANVHAENVYGKSPFELLLESGKASRKEIEIFLEHGCRLHAFNRLSQVGYVALLLFSQKDVKLQNLLQVALSYVAVNDVDYMGRTILHNIVSYGILHGEHEFDLIEYVVKQGVDINHQDQLGRTALHVAAQFTNHDAIKKLLSSGANINIHANGETAFSYALDLDKCLVYPYSGIPYYYEKQRMFDVFVKYVYIMQLHGVYVSDVNRRTQIRAIGESHVNAKVHKFRINMNEIRESFETIRYERIGTTTFHLDDFMSETCAIVAYPKMSLDVRKKMKIFFQNTIAEPRFKGWRFLCRLQYRKAVARSQLVELAKEAANVVLGFPLPDLCFEVIQKFLANTDLESVITAAEGSGEDLSILRVFPTLIADKFAKGEPYFAKTGVEDTNNKVVINSFSTF